MAKIENPRQRLAKSLKTIQYRIVQATSRLKTLLAEVAAAKERLLAYKAQEREIRATLRDFTKKPNSG